MRKPVAYTLVAVSILLLGATAVLFQKYRETSANYLTVKAEEETTRNRYGAAINSIAAIQDSLNAIVLGDSTVGLDGYGNERRLTQSQGDEVLGRVAIIRAGVDRAKARIQQLDSSLKKSGIKVAGLERMIANLRRSVGEKEQDITLLTGRVDSLQNQVTGLVAEVQQNEETIQTQVADIEEKRSDLATIYYTIGKKKDLTESGIVVAEGGVLGMGKTLKPSGQVDATKFTAMDTDQENTVRIPSTKAQVLSAQPPSSYSLQLVGNEMQLVILDPAEFRKVKHLVIMTQG